MHMLALGQSSQEEHEKIGAYCSKDVDPRLLVTVGPESRFIAIEAVKRGMKSDAVLQYDNVDALLPRLDDILKQGNLLYVKASNGIKLNKIIQSTLNMRAQ